jgi:hypothetical protein
MATRSGIGAMRPDGSVRGIYCHWDGDLSRGGVGWTLAKFYASSQRVESLFDLGDCSRLRPGLGQRHDFDNPRANWSVFYGRDRGERGRTAVMYDTVDEFVHAMVGRHAEFVYVWHCERCGWHVADRFEFPSFRPVFVALASTEEKHDGIGM